ncbi:MAG TPA: hypothetical protein VMM56_17415 [Planctomycetaceae bacterium]|nr:hypothetical protein [Planctomycetaceae bacterium]
MNPPNNVHPKLIGILGYLMLVTTAIVFTYVYVSPLDLSTAEESILVRITPLGFTQLLIRNKFAFRGISLISIMFSVGFLMYVYCHREKRKQYRLWPMGLFCLCACISYLWLVITMNH